MGVVEKEKERERVQGNGVVCARDVNSPLTALYVKFRKLVTFVFILTSFSWTLHV